LHGASFYALTCLARAARAARPAATFDSAAQTLAGDTLDVERVESVAPADVDTPIGAGEVAPSEPKPAPVSRSSHPRGSADAPTQGGAATAKPALYGAVGVRFAVDLATTFTRAFPQAASADPAWTTAPFGSAGAADVTLWLDDEGHLAGTSIDGSPSNALRRGIERTLTLLGSRPFTARSAVSRLRLRARVSRDDVHDGLHGDVFALSGGSFAGDTGSAFFALPPEGAAAGRRVDVELRLLP
jgi:hypothetical protein